MGLRHRILVVRVESKYLYLLSHLSGPGFPLFIFLELGLFVYDFLSFEKIRYKKIWRPLHCLAFQVFYNHLKLCGFFPPSANIKTFRVHPAPADYVITSTLHKVGSFLPDDLFGQGLQVSDRFPNSSIVSLPVCVQSRASISLAGASGRLLKCVAAVVQLSPEILDERHDLRYKSRQWDGRCSVSLLTDSGQAFSDGLRKELKLPTTPDMVNCTPWENVGCFDMAFTPKSLFQWCIPCICILMLKMKNSTFFFLVFRLFSAHFLLDIFCHG